MTYFFIPVSGMLKTIEKPLIDELHDYGLLSKFSKDAKRLITYFFIKKLNEYIKFKDTILVHDRHLSIDHHEILEYYPEQEFNNFINKLCVKIKKLTGRLIFITKTKFIENAKIKDMDGAIVDEIILLNNQKPSDPKKLKEFLSEYSLGELFDSFTIHLNV